MAHTLAALKRLPLLSELVLVIAFAWMLAGWLLPTHQAPQSNFTNAIATASNNLPNLTTLMNTKLFGQEPQAKASAPVAQPKRTIVMQALHLKLLGTVVAGRHSAAIIATRANNKQAAFFIGDRIQAGVTLKTVEANAITVDHNGQLERISLEQSQQISPLLMPRMMQASRTPSPRPQTNSASTNKQVSTQNLNRRINRNRLQQQLQNVPALLSQALAKPHFANGKVDGFTISNIVPGSLYQQAGLINGDRIVTINGKKITNAAQAMSIYNTLKNASSLDLQLIRGSGMQNIHFDIR